MHANKHSAHPGGGGHLMQPDSVRHRRQQAVAVRNARQRGCGKWTAPRSSNPQPPPHPNSLSVPQPCACHVALIFPFPGSVPHRGPLSFLLIYTGVTQQQHFGLPADSSCCSEVSRTRLEQHIIKVSSLGVVDRWNLVNRTRRSHACIRRVAKGIPANQLQAVLVNFSLIYCTVGVPNMVNSARHCLCPL